MSRLVLVSLILLLIFNINISAISDVKLIYNSDTFFENDICSLSLAMFSDGEANKYVLAMYYDGKWYFYPDWQFSIIPILNELDTGLTAFQVFTFIVPDGLDFELPIKAILYREDDSGINVLKEDNVVFNFIDTTPPQEGDGYITGYARVRVTNVNNPPPPEDEKGIIFCLGNSKGDDYGWLNVRHRTLDGSAYQIKGGVGTYNSCGDEVNYWYSQKACDGDWEVWWDGNTGTITVNSPCGSETINIPYAVFTFDMVGTEPGCGGYIWWDSPAHAEVIEFYGEMGYSQFCNQ